MMTTLLFVLALLLYVGASAVLAASFASGRRGTPRAGRALTGGAVMVHGAALVAFVARYGELPLVGLAPSLATLAFLIALFLTASSLVTDSRPVGLVLVPIIAVLLAIGLVLGIAPAGQPLAFRGVWFSLHVLLAFIGYAGLSISFAASLLWLLQFRELKDRRLGRVFRFFPALPVLDRLGRGGVSVGFPALTLALLLGWAFTVRFQGTLAATDPQVIWGVLTWFVFAALLAIRMLGGVNAERRAAQASIAGFALVVVSYLVLRVFVTGGGVFL